MIKNKTDLKEYFQEKLFIYQRQMTSLTSVPENSYLAMESIAQIRGKINLIEEISKDLDMGTIRRKPPVKDLII